MVNDIPEWPYLLVAGVDITKEQASRVILGTVDVSGLVSNDDYWTDVIAWTVGLDHQGQGVLSASSVAHVRSRWHNTGVQLLANDRILTMAVEGPQGWCDWQGRIGGSSYPVGPDPTVEQVTEELTRLARAFDFLEIQVQLADDDHVPLARWGVSGGVVHVFPCPGDLLFPVVETVVDVEAMMSDRWGRGVGLSRLRRAMEDVGDVR